MGGRIINIYRRTALLIDAGALNPDASIAMDRQPSANAFLELTVTGAGVFGTLTVNGDVSGVPTSEVVTFTGNETQLTVNRFDTGTITTIDPAGWDAGTFTAKATGSDGSRIHGTTTVAVNVRGHLNRGISANWFNVNAGVTEYEKTWFALDYTSLWAPREGDIFVDQGNGEEWLVVSDPSWLGSHRQHHWEIRVSRNQGSLAT